MSTTSYTLGQAAKHTGLTKSGISRAIKQGRLRASKRDDGSYEIDIAELGRFVADRKEGQPGRPSNTQLSQQFDNPLETRSSTPDSTALHVRIAELEANLNYKDALLDDRERQLRETRSDLEKWREQATRLLEGPSRPARSWWDRLMGRG